MMDYLDENHKNIIFAECRRLECAGYNVVCHVQPSESNDYARHPSWSLTPFAYYCDFTTPGIRAYKNYR